jgi:hypothetical protein
MDSQSELLSLAVLKAIKDGELDPANVFGDRPVGAGKQRLICNSVPKSGTYLLVELAKLMGFVDVGFHLNTDFVERRTTDEMTDQPRPMPLILQVAGLKDGQCAPAHFQFSFVVENYLLSNTRYKMLFIIRDPRDLVVSWVDFVYSSNAYRSSEWNANCQVQGALTYPDDESRLAASIDGLLAMGLEGYLPWMNSPACLTVRFEDIYREVCTTGYGPELEKVAKYIGQPISDASAVLGKGRTASSRRQTKIGVFRERMSDKNLARIAQPDFQKLVLQFGYPEI